MDLGAVNVVAIAILAYWVGKAVKRSPIDGKWIPVIVAAFGGVMGIIAYLIGMPDFPATDIITAAAVGCSSATAASAYYDVKNHSVSTDEDAYG